MTGRQIDMKDTVAGRQLSTCNKHDRMPGRKQYVEEFENKGHSNAHIYADIVACAGTGCGSNPKVVDMWTENNWQPVAVERGGDQACANVTRWHVQA